MLAGAETTSVAVVTEGTRSASREDEVRAHTYALLGALFRSPPNEDLLELLRGIEAHDAGPDDGFAAAWEVLRLAGTRADPAALDDEYHDLFVGVGRGELVPYGSWYVTGFTMDRPLALLRNDLAALGFERQEKVTEPEDHVAALLETMSMMVASDEFDVDAQRRFFQAHVGPWMRTFFVDLQTAESARFYRAVGQFAEQFIEFETKYLTMLV